MSNNRSQFDFRRYGKFMLIGALFAGIFLSRHAWTCFKKQVDDFQLAGEVDDGSNKSLISDSGSVDKGTKGDYAENFGEGAGFFGYMGGAIPYCTERSTFKDPIYVFYAFWALLGMGLLFTFLDKLIKPTWKKELKQKGKANERDKRETSKMVDDMERQRKSDRKKKPKIEAIDIDLGGDSGGGGGGGGSDFLMTNDDHTSSTSMPSHRGGGGGGMSAEKKRDLAALGLGADPGAGIGSDWLDSDDDEDPSLDPLGDSAPVRKPAGGGGGGGLGLMSAPISISEGGSKPTRKKLKRAPGRAPKVSTARPESLSGTDLDEDVDFFDPMAGRSSLWMPVGRVDDPFIYVVTPEDATGAGLRDGTRPNRATAGIQAGIDAAYEHINAGKTVQLRLMPGVYREMIDLPAGVALVNHHIPNNLSTDELRFWLTGDEDFDHDHHVVIALPEEADEHASTITARDARDVILAGLHIAGRGEIDPDTQEEAGGGVLFEGADKATLFLCHFVGHRKAGDGAALCVMDSGHSVDDRILVQDSLFEMNAASGRGGAVYAEGSTVVLRGCALQANQSATAGGAVCIRGCETPVLLEDCTVADNAVERPGELPSASRGGWKGKVGHGGGIYAHSSGLHLRRTDVLGNVAQGAGGGIFATRSKLLLEGETNPPQPIRIADNQALRGGGILLSGVVGEDASTMTVLRGAMVELIANHATESGGGLAAFRLAQIELQDCGLLQNTVDAKHGEGGGLHATLGCRIKLSGTRIEKNTAPFRGAGMSVCNSSLRMVKDCAVLDNETPEGDSALAFYTMDSQLLPDLKAKGLIEDPVVCAIGPCQIQNNRAHHGVGGLFIGNYSRTSTSPIAFALKAPDQIADNAILEDGQYIKRGDTTKKRPVDLMVAWKGAVRNDDKTPPMGKRILR